VQKIQNIQHYEPDGGAAGSPPSYADSQAAGPSTTPAEQLRPTNFMNIDRNYGPIKDTWVIDTNIQIPEALLPPLGFFASLRTRPNLALHSAKGSIRASVFLVSSSSSRAILKADTAYGNVAIQVSTFLVPHSPLVSPRFHVTGNPCRLQATVQTVGEYQVW
jgi:hypothetical protein